jgi:hypothetical protein
MLIYIDQDQFYSQIDSNFDQLNYIIQKKNIF